VLLFSGLFAIFLSFRREFLPHDVSYLGMSAAELCRLADCRVVRFMFHDRVAFGGSLISIAVLYFWLAAFPLLEGAAWAWWAFVASGTLGFASFLTYFGYGYLDVWHGTATLVLLPTFMLGLLYSRRLATARVTPWIRTDEMKSAPWVLKSSRPADVRRPACQPTSYSHLNTHADRVTQIANTTASAARSPACASHPSPRQMPLISDTA
jgi:hypothetical protein